MSCPWVKLERDNIVFRPWFRKKRISLHDICRIESYKLDKITFEENFIMLHLFDGREFPFGEFDDGFALLIDKLQALFQPFPADWHEVLAIKPAFVRNLIWDHSLPGHCRSSNPKDDASNFPDHGSAEY